MLRGTGYLEILALLVLILLLFGPGRIAKVANELGRGIKEFKDGLSGSKSNSKEEVEDQTESAEKKEDK
ncbi:MAG: twin-arginine translocase TatA/TatE family subunit [Chloroflexi bacterium]|jgi:sec-independent protein translocase protein TatA|nr:twin-arginine translocase TatA/TatE family subunit [Chloroflexota bacterium]